MRSVVTLRAHANLCVCDHEMHVNTLECSFVVHHQLQSQYSINIVQFQVSHYILRIYVHICTHVSIHCSIAVVVVMQYAHFGVWCLPKLVQMLISVLGPSNVQYTCSCEF